MKYESSITYSRINFGSSDDPIINVNLLVIGRPNIKFSFAVSDTFVVSDR